MSEIKQFYVGKNVLVTGVTGFIGKVLVEKILRECDGINMMYLIMRGGKNGFRQRSEDYLKHLVFDKIRQDNPKQLDKIKIFNGDLSQHELGLNNEELQEIYDSVHIVLHAGANVRFDLEMWEALNTNTLGTHRMLELAKRIKYLEIFVYVSTTYSQSYLDVTEECHYKSQIDTWTLVKACKRFDENTMNALQAKILGDFPNTYSFSKHLSEDLVYQYRNEFPICVVRPSVVMAAYKDPLPNYCEGLNGFFGFGLVAARGVLRTVHTDVDSIVFFVPVDMVVNAVLTTSWLHGTERRNQIEFYNASVSRENSGNFQYFIQKLRDFRYKYPLDFAIWYPGGCVTTCIYYYYIRYVLFQIIPAISIDILLVLFRQRPIMIEIQRKIITASNNVLSYCTSRFTFITERFCSLQHHQNELDKIIFDTNISKEDKESMVASTMKGVRKFCAKEKDENIPRARTTLKILYWIELVAKLVALYYLLKFVWFRYLSDIQL